LPKGASPGEGEESAACKGKSVIGAVRYSWLGMTKAGAGGDTLISSVRT